MTDPAALADLIADIDLDTMCHDDDGRPLTSAETAILESATTADLTAARDWLNAQVLGAVVERDIHQELHDLMAPIMADRPDLEWLAAAHLLPASDRQRALDLAGACGHATAVHPPGQDQ